MQKTKSLELAAFLKDGEAEQLRHRADAIADVDFRMQEIRHHIDKIAELEQTDGGRYENSGRQ